MVTQNLTSKILVLAAIGLALACSGQRQGPELTKEQQEKLNNYDKVATDAAAQKADLEKERQSLADQQAEVQTRNEKLATDQADLDSSKKDLAAKIDKYNQALAQYEADVKANKLTADQLKTEKDQVDAQKAAILAQTQDNDAKAAEIAQGKNANTDEAERLEREKADRQSGFRGFMSNPAREEAIQSVTNGKPWPFVISVSALRMGMKPGPDAANLRKITDVSELAAFDQIVLKTFPNGDVVAGRIDAQTNTWRYLVTMRTMDQFWAVFKALQAWNDRKAPQREYLSYTFFPAKNFKLASWLRITYSKLMTDINSPPPVRNIFIGLSGSIPLNNEVGLNKDNNLSNINSYFWTSYPVKDCSTTLSATCIEAMGKTGYIAEKTTNDKGQLVLTVRYITSIINEGIRLPGSGNLSSDIFGRAGFGDRVIVDVRLVTRLLAMDVDDNTTAGPASSAQAVDSKMNGLFQPVIAGGGGWLELPLTDPAHKDSIGLKDLFLSNEARYISNDRPGDSTARVRELGNIARVLNGQAL